ncbi:MAG: nucleotidyltransferase family protein [Selenomonadaceae bacterium]|nr:nucleotidyltransferase family protein [Selenomonadaceae bacterium]
MHVTGIICEYNPFHNGHAWQMAEVRRRQPDTVVVAIMSGSFCQRGSAALMDKFTRARLAVLGGCDLVIELPFVFACRSAQDFARGGVGLLIGLGLPATLAFGAECDDLPCLQQAASAMDTPAVQQVLHERLQQGTAYAAALTAILSEQTGLHPDVLRQPNTILALEYLRALQHTPKLQPLLLPRHGAGHHENRLLTERDNGQKTGVLHFASGSAIRQTMLQAQQTGNAPDWPRLAAAVPAATLQALQDGWSQDLPRAERLFPALQLAFLRYSDAELGQLAGSSIAEGMAGRLRHALSMAGSLGEWIQRAATRRYPAARIRRLLPYLLLGITADELARVTAGGPAYAHILAASPRGLQLLHIVKDTATLPLVTKFSTILNSCQRQQGWRQLIATGKFTTPARQQAALDTLATDLRALMLSELPARNDFNTSPFIRHEDK